MIQPLDKSAEFWARKIRAFTSRLPGEGNPTDDALIAHADQVAFGFDRLPSALAADAQTAWVSPIAIHALTGKEQPLYGLEGANWQEVAGACRAFIAAVKQCYPDNPRRQFMALWRLLPEPGHVPDLPESHAAALKRWWRILPADARSPLQGLWDHQALVSALVGTERDGQLQPALLQFNVADAQPFVTRARRTQDLWAGSYLLSYFSWRMLRSLASTYGPDCILSPALRGQPLADLWLRDVERITEVLEPTPEMLMVANIPNIFTALLPADEVETAVNTAICQAREEWGRISEAVRDQVEQAAWHGGVGWDEQCNTIWKRQTDDFLRGNLFWAALPLPVHKSLTEAEVRNWLRDHQALVRPSGKSTQLVTSLCQAYPAHTTGGLLYGVTSEATARALGDRKRLRDFMQIDEPGQKCSLSGVLQAIVPASPPVPLPAALRAETNLAPGSLGWVRAWWSGLAAVNQHPYKMTGRIRPGDQLCAISAVKRLVLQAYFEKASTPGVPRFDRHQFPSTAGIANALVIKETIQRARADTNLHQAIDHYVQAVSQFANSVGADFLYKSSVLPCWIKAAQGDTRLEAFARVEGDCLNLELYEAERLHRELHAVIPDGADSLLHKARQACAVLRSQLPASPTPYYAVVAMDGDSMGKWISGQALQSQQDAPTQYSLKGTLHPAVQDKAGELASEPRPLTPALHLLFTEALSGFALRDARRIVEEEHAGKLVYAGGDDVLALLPVADLLPALNSLYHAFRGNPVNGAQSGEPGNATGYVEPGGICEARLGAATISAGAVIVHSAQPLAYALEQARDAEHAAKAVYGRDAFCLRLLRRSGAPLEAGSKWQAVSTTGDHFDVCTALVEAANLMSKPEGDKPATLSSRLPYTLAVNALENTGHAWGLAESGGAVPSSLRQARQSEFQRIARRHRQARGEETLPAFEGFLHQFGAMAGGSANSAWEQTANLLRIARAIRGGESDP